MLWALVSQEGSEHPNRMAASLTTVSGEAQPAVMNEAGRIGLRKCHPKLNGCKRRPKDRQMPTTQAPRTADKVSNKAAVQVQNQAGHRPDNSLTCRGTYCTIGSRLSESGPRASSLGLTLIKCKGSHVWGPRTDMLVRPQVSHDVTWKNLGNSVVLLNLTDSTYYVLNETASVVFQGILDGEEYPQIAERLASAYDCTVDQAQADVVEVTEYWRSEHLLK